jgi:purine-binding chemotaxis protein CheW
VLGVINLRGAVIPIVDLSLCLGLGPSPNHARNVVIVASVNRRTFGILVGSVSEILSIRRDEVRENPTQMKENAPNYITGLLTVGDGEMLRILDLTELVIQGPDR